MNHTTRARLLLVAGCLLAASGMTLAQSSASDEEVARRQLESGRAFVRQGNFTEALKDFRAVADTHGSSSVADNALLEIARYYLDTLGDTKEASTAVEAILKTYPTSDSAPDAYLMAGRLALAKSHSAADLDTALANFERVARLFPASDVVPRSLVYAAETHRFAGRYELALANLGRVGLEYPKDPAAVDAHLSAGSVLLALGDPVSAMEELQQVRNYWPDSPDAATALARTTILHRLYVRALRGPAFALAAEPVGPAKLKDVIALAVSGRGAVYSTSQDAPGIVTPNSAPAPGTGGKPRGLTVDIAGNVVVIEAAALRPVGGTPIPLVVTRGTGAQEPLKSADTAIQLSSGDWLVMDENERGIQRFSRSGTYVGPFVATKVARLAVNTVDEIAGLDKDQKAVVLFDATGKTTGRVPLKGAGYDLSNPVDIAYDTFGHLYVLDRAAIAVFSPFDAPAVAGPAAAPATPVTGSRAALATAAAAAAAKGYRLVTLFAEPQNNQAGFRRATSFALDRSGSVYLYDDRAERVLVYR